MRGGVAEIFSKKLSVTESRRLRKFIFMQNPEKFPYENSDERPPRTIHERLEAFYDLIREAPPASNFSEAYNLVRRSLEEVEKAEFDMMRVNEFSELSETSVGNRKVLIDSYFGHLLFLGDNGSIEIRRKNKDDFPDRHATHFDAETILNKSETKFSKPGADGKKIWD